LKKSCQIDKKSSEFEKNLTGVGGPEQLEQGEWSDWMRGSGATGVGGAECLECDLERKNILSLKQNEIKHISFFSLKA
jgi:hypothetical protein